MEFHSYLVDTGWLLAEETWRGGSIWSRDGEYELLLPPNDEVGDVDRRKREVLKTLAEAENRSFGDVLLEVGSPFVDVQLYRTHPSSLPPGFTELKDGLRKLQGVSQLIRGAAQATALRPPREPEGWPAAGSGQQLGSEILERAQIGLNGGDESAICVRVPVGHEDSERRVRAVLTRLHDIVRAAHSTTESARLNGRFDIFDGASSAGLSAKMCAALSDLSGPRREDPFEVGFRWGRGLVSVLPPSGFRFDPGDGQILRQAATYLGQERSFEGARAVVVGVVRELHDDSERNDRWRIMVSGTLTPADRESRRREVWVRLPGPQEYDQAINAHRESRLVRVTGTLSAGRGGRSTVTASIGGFQSGD
jgi:hypothetical protein